MRRRGMTVNRGELADRYAAMSVGELAALRPDDLTEVARDCLNEELARRGIEAKTTVVGRVPQRAGTLGSRPALRLARFKPVATLLPAIVLSEVAEHLRTSESILVGLAVCVGTIFVSLNLWFLPALISNRKKPGFPRRLRRFLPMLVLGIAGLAALYIWVVQPVVTLHRFNKHFKEYLDAANASVGPISSESASLSGKVIPLDLDANQIDPMLFDLPEHLRPNSPDEVGTILTLSCRKELVGSYGSGTNVANGAYRWGCRARLYDRQTTALVSDQNYAGPSPPPTSVNGASQTGPKPYDEILASLSAR